MRAFAAGAPPRNDYTACSGCSLCLLVCPAWRQKRDPRISPEGRAKALQAGAPISELAASASACTLCGACEPVCPERIDLIGMTLGLRRQLADKPPLQALRVQSAAGARDRPAAAPLNKADVLLCGPALKARPELLERICALLGAAAVADEGADVALALAAGVPVPSARLEAFLAPLRTARTILVDDGLWLRLLRAWLPRARLAGLGEVLSGLEAVRSALRSTDLYLIEARAYHADYERLVRHYDRLRFERGCSFNLDLQRIAIPARARSLAQSLGLEAVDDSAQAAWILKGRQVQRIVVENLDDAAAFIGEGAPPVVHLAELADH